MQVVNDATRCAIPQNFARCAANLFNQNDIRLRIFIRRTRDARHAFLIEKWITECLLKFCKKNSGIFI